MTSRNTGRTFAAASLAVFALLVAGLASPASAATDTGKLKGTVTFNGTPLSFAKVQIYRGIFDKDEGSYDISDKRLKTDNTDSKGRYSFSGLSAKTSTTSHYLILVSDRAGKVVKTYRDVVIRKGKTLTKNVRLKPAAIFTGAVSRSDGRSPAGLTVRVGVPGSPVDEAAPNAALAPNHSTMTNANGTFRLSGLAIFPRQQLIVSDGPYAEQCYDFGRNALVECASDPTTAGGQFVNLAAGERALPPVTLSKSAPPVTRVAGTVTDASGKAIKGIKATLQSATPRVSVFAVTRSSGRYTLNESIPAGTYTLRFDDPSNKWAAQFLGGGPDKVVRRQIVVTPGQPLNFDTELKSASTAKLASKPGNGSAKVSVQIKRKVSVGRPSGTLTLRFGSLTTSVTVSKGKATATLTGIPRGRRLIYVDYSGTSNTAGFAKSVLVKVK